MLLSDVSESVNDIHLSLYRIGVSTFKFDLVSSVLINRYLQLINLKDAMKKMYMLFAIAALMITSSCYTTRTAGNSGKVPPGQAKKKTGAKSAKHFAPGQRKK